MSQLLSEAFKIAFAHRTLRRSIASESKGSKDKDKKSKDSKSPWDMLKRKDKKSPAASPSLTHVDPSAPPPPRPTSSGNAPSLAPPTSASGQGQVKNQSPVMRRRTGSVSSGKIYTQLHVVHVHLHVFVLIITLYSTHM